MRRRRRVQSTRQATLATRATDRLWDAPHAEIVEFIDRELARTPLGHLEPDDYAFARTDAMYPIFGPGHLESLIRFARRVGRSPRLFFAGDYLVGAGLDAALQALPRQRRDFPRSGKNFTARLSR